MARSPDQQIQQNGRQVNSLARQPVVDSAPIGLFTFAHENAGLFQLMQPVGKNVGRNSFSGFLELLERVVASHHQVTNNQ